MNRLCESASIDLRARSTSKADAFAAPLGFMPAEFLWATTLLWGLPVSISRPLPLQAWKSAWKA